MYFLGLQVPLSGYGGVSKLIVEDVHETDHGCYSINVGQVTTSKSPIICTVTVFNVGRRSAFVKALGFQGKLGVEKLPNRKAPNRKAPNRKAPNRKAPNRKAPNRKAQ